MFLPCPHWTQGNQGAYRGFLAGFFMDAKGVVLGGIKNRYMQPCLLQAPYTHQMNLMISNHSGLVVMFLRTRVAFVSLCFCSGVGIQESSMLGYFSSNSRPCVCWQKCWYEGLFLNIVSEFHCNLRFWEFYTSTPARTAVGGQSEVNAWVLGELNHLAGWTLVIGTQQKRRRVPWPDWERCPKQSLRHYSGWLLPVTASSWFCGHKIDIAFTINDPEFWSEVLS